MTVSLRFSVQMTRVWRGLGPDSGSGSVFFSSSDSDRFRPCRVRIRIGSAGPGSDSDRIRLRGFGFGSDTGAVRILHPNPGLAVATTGGRGRGYGPGDVEGWSAMAQVAALELRVEELQEQVAEHTRAEAAADRLAQACMAQVAQLTGLLWLAEQDNVLVAMAAER